MSPARPVVLKGSRPGRTSTDGGRKGEAEEHTKPEPPVGSGGLRS